jgi:hypothetical protein
VANRDLWHTNCSQRQVGKDAQMHNQTKVLGVARRIRVRTRFGGYCQAWDCRPFGFGRIVAPLATGAIEIAPRVELDLAKGEIRAEASLERRLA